MNKLFIIGNLTRDPELRQNKDGVPVCTFTVAVNRKRSQGVVEQTDFFRVTAWRGLAENCAKYLQKGRKVGVTGTVGISTYTGKDGMQHADLTVSADDVEFLTGSGMGDRVASGYANPPTIPPAQPQKKDEYIVVTEGDLPF